MAAQDLPIRAVDALHTAINASDVGGSSNLFADDAVVIEPRIGGLPQIYVGQEQIRWWLRSLIAQHVHWSMVQPARLLGAQNIQWSDALGIDAFRQVGLDSVEVKSEALLASDGRIEALTMVLTPAAARSIQLAPGGATQTDASELPAADAILGAVLLLAVGFGAGAGLTQVANRRRQQPVSVADQLVVSRS